MPELPPVTMAFWPLSTLLIGQAGITGSGNCSSMNFLSGMCIRSAGIIAGVGFSKSVSLEFMFVFGLVCVCRVFLVSCIGRENSIFLTNAAMLASSVRLL